ncbi:hypothetical protein TNCV_561661 [Trichonephila clavipes]|uniref:Uncharacterized protein n=1 Tax=Trichonephila clavipes TaxID=2585209 RepID=A0A8X6VF18_TRICX|nr:hypothetical protein TNCV_561661 [Trichonephila clavipes]
MPLKGLKYLRLSRIIILCLANMNLLLLKLIILLCGDETENYSENLLILVVENQHINPAEEPKFMANADSNTPKNLVNAFDLKPLPKST